MAFTISSVEHPLFNMMSPFMPVPGLKISFVSAFLVFGFAVAMPGRAADKKPKSTPAMPSTIPPTSPMLAIPPVEPAGGAGQPPGKLISSEMSGRDLEFFTTAVAAGREQSYLVGFLRTKATSDQIKSLADSLNGAQEEENKHLAKLATLKGLDLSLEPAAVEKKDGVELDKLTGADFDKAAVEKIGAASHRAMTAYQNAAESSDPEIKKFASQMLPLAEEKRHLIEKMTATGKKAAEKSPDQAAPAKTPAVTPAPKPSTPPKSTPSGKTGHGTKPIPTPKPTATPTPLPTSATGPIATPPGQTLPVGTPGPLPPAIVPSRKAAVLPPPAPIPLVVPN